ncbi:MAG: hypothetical protein H6672_08830 [Anaerolineaceae bacterium]|nr:hypothetical protein [Anaerolineaceae bacterium]
MSPLAVRRLIVWVVSMVLGFVVGWLIVVVGYPVIKPESAGITVQDFGTMYFLVLSVPIGLIFVTWLDLFFDTKILSE